MDKLYVVTIVLVGLTLSPPHIVMSLTTPPLQIDTSSSPLAADVAAINDASVSSGVTTTLVSSTPPEQHSVSSSSSPTFSSSSSQDASISSSMSAFQTGGAGGEVSLGRSAPDMSLSSQSSSHISVTSVSSPAPVLSSSSEHLSSRSDVQTARTITASSPAVAEGTPISEQSDAETVEVRVVTPTLTTVSPSTSLVDDSHSSVESLVTATSTELGLARTATPHLSLSSSPSAGVSYVSTATSSLVSGSSSQLVVSPDTVRSAGASSSGESVAQTASHTVLSVSASSVSSSDVTVSSIFSDVIAGVDSGTSSLGIPSDSFTITSVVFSMSTVASFYPSSPELSAASVGDSLLPSSTSFLGTESMTFTALPMSYLETSSLSSDVSASLEQTLHESLLQSTPFLSSSTAHVGLTQSDVPSLSDSSPSLSELVGSTMTDTDEDFLSMSSSAESHAVAMATSSIDLVTTTSIATLPSSSDAVLVSSLPTPSSTQTPVQPTASTTTTTTTTTTNKTTQPTPSPTSTPGSVEESNPQDARYLLTMRGDCGLVLNNTEFFSRFLVGLHDLVVKQFKVGRDTYRLGHISCGSVRVYVTFLQVTMPQFDFRLQSIVRNGGPGLSIPVWIDTHFATFDLRSARHVPLSPEERTMNIVTEVMDDVDIIVIIVACCVCGVLIAIGIAICAKECYRRKHAQSFNLLDVPHVNLKLEDFTLTRIPRPRTVFPQPDHPPPVKSFAQSPHDAAHDPDAALANGNTNGEAKVCGNGAPLQPSDIHLRVSQHSDGIVVGLTSSSSSCSPDSRHSHPYHHQQHQDTEGDSSPRLSKARTRTPPASHELQASQRLLGNNHHHGDVDGTVNPVFVDEQDEGGLVIGVVGTS